ncbi:MAG: hypothetical protein ACRDOD_05500 [Streptosporangiaceae bacterium]
MSTNGTRLTRGQGWVLLTGAALGERLGRRQMLAAGSACPVSAVPVPNPAPKIEIRR